MIYKVSHVYNTFQSQGILLFLLFLDFPYPVQHMNHLRRGQKRTKSLEYGKCPETGKIESLGHFPYSKVFRFPVSGQFVFKGFCRFHIQGKQENNKIPLIWHEGSLNSESVWKKEKDKIHWIIKKRFSRGAMRHALQGEGHWILKASGNRKKTKSFE